MDIYTIVIIAFALAMDAFAVSIASGVAIRNMHIKHALTIALWFGVFQAVMPVLGWLCGIKLSEFIAGIDHWVVFAILLIIGGKMIYEAFKLEPIEEKADPLNVYVLFGLSIATSLDAFGVGLSFAIQDVSIIAPVLIIGAVAFVLSFIGVWLGDKGAHFFEKKMEIAAGVILILIGLKTLLTGLMA